MAQAPSLPCRAFSPACLAVALLLTAAPVLAQQSSLSGRILDSTDLAISGATLIATEQATGIQRSTQSNDSGFYNLTDLTPGTYDISIEAQGFQKQQRQGLVLNVAQNAQLDLNLSLGAVAQSLTITEAAGASTPPMAPSAQ